MADSNMGTDSPPLSNTSLAVLIDADNTPQKIVDGLFEEIAKFGTASVKRIYGDWTKPNLGGWKSVLLKHSVQPIQQFAYTQGKNATDCSMIIDAMDLLYTKQLSGFCLVSSDSDFTRLAARLREEGLTVYGFGERKTPGPSWPPATSLSTPKYCVPTMPPRAPQTSPMPPPRQRRLSARSRRHCN